jgi:O-antigen ligase
MKSHNDYLRLLLETGIIGFALFLFIWGAVYLKMGVQYRWAVVMVAIYCITENNYDHFPAMSLLIFYMLSAKELTEQKELPVDAPVSELKEH